MIVFNERHGEQVLIAKKDGRRSKDYPEALMGWRYMGALDEYGKPVGAPHWVELHVRSDMVTGLASVKIARFPLPRDLNVGDWVCRLPDVSGRPNREIHCVLTAAEVRKWYGV